MSLEQKVDSLLDAFSTFESEMLAGFGKLSLALQVLKFKEFRNEVRGKFTEEARKRIELEKRLETAEDKLKKASSYCSQLDARLKHLENPNGLKQHKTT